MMKIVFIDDESVTLSFEEHSGLEFIGLNCRYGFKWNRRAVIMRLINPDAAIVDIRCLRWMGVHS